MAKYHVGKDGQARPCKAASADSCPLAKADDSGVVKHFDSLDAAQSYGERVAMGLVGEDSSHEAPVAGVREAKDSERPATDDEISAYVFAANRETLQNDVSVVPSSDGLEDSLSFKAATAEEKALIRDSLDRADAAVASGDFDAATDEYQVAAEHLGYDHGTDSFQPYDPVLDRLKDRWSLAYFASHAYSDKEHQLEAGSYFLADGAYVVPFYRRGDDDEDGIRR